MGHEQVVFCNDSETGLKHCRFDTTLGPALEQECGNILTSRCLYDVLRLSRGMTYAQFQDLN